MKNNSLTSEGNAGNGRTAKITREGNELNLADEDFNGRIVRGLWLRKSDLDLVRVQDIGLSGASDEKKLLVLRQRLNFGLRSLSIALLGKPAVAPELLALTEH